MRFASRSNLAIAASLAALAIVGPLAFTTYSDRPMPSLTTLTKTVEPEVAATAPAKTAEHQLKKKVEIKTVPVVPSAALGPGPAAEPAPPPQTTASEGLALPAPSPSPSLLGNLLGSGANAPMPTVPPSYLAAGSRGGMDALATRGLGGALLDSESPVAMLPGDNDEAARLRLDDEGRDIFNAPEPNPVKEVSAEPVSTFSFDVDTASYSFVRRALNAGHLPPKQAVRVEELINYFPYSYPGPDTADVPFKPTVTVMPSPWKPTNKLVHIAIKGYDLKPAERPRANLVFLMDISGSMEADDRLPLVKNALRLLLDQLQPNDTVGIVTYASGSGIALEPTKVSEKGKILAAIDKLEAGGSTAGASGIEDAYRLAEAGFDKSAVNRIILATDGDFNVGITDRDQLTSYIERKRKTGIYLSILGVGAGNHNDALMQALAQNGNGTAAYVDTLNEARKVLVDEASSTLFTIAKDVKAQVEWNPARVAEYRLIGYETRALKREDFNNDAVDAGDIGSGHTVTAIYEVTPVGAPRLVDDLRYAKAEVEASAARPAVTTAANESQGSELGFLKLRYKRPNEENSQLISLPITDALAKPAMDDVPQDVRFSVAVAAFGDLLRGAPFLNGFGFDDVIALAQSSRGDDPYGYRAEFLNLARLAKSARP